MAAPSNKSKAYPIVLELTKLTLQIPPPLLREPKQPGALGRILFWSEGGKCLLQNWEEGGATFNKDGHTGFGQETLFLGPFAVHFALSLFALSFWAWKG